MKKLVSSIETPLDCRLARALEPDDVGLPEGMEIVHECVGGRWRIRVSYVVNRPDDILTLKNTLDDIVRALQVIEKSIPQ
jgi:hypothetical protein